MATHNVFGNQAELYAANYLVEKGYKVLDKNWRYQKAEIDIKESKIFLEQSQVLLGEDKFNELIGEIKSRVLFGNHTQAYKKVKSPIGYLITLIKSELLGVLPLDFDNISSKRA